MANGITWHGKSLKGVDKTFLARVTTAALAQGATTIFVYSARRTKATNTGVSNSNHLYGHALDAKAFVPGRGWIPLGTLLSGTAGDYGLRSGDQPRFYKNAPDPNHVDDGFNVNNYRPLDARKSAPQQQPESQQPESQQQPQPDQSQPDQPPHPVFNVTPPPGPGGLGVPGVGLPGEVDTQATSLPPESPQLSTWKLLASQSDASLETLRYAQMAQDAYG